MKKLLILGFLVLFVPVIVYSQAKVEAPVWNIGDKWSLTGDVSIMVVSADGSSYTVKYLTPGGDSILIYEKSSLNRLYSMEGDTRIQYEGRNKRLFNFPLDIGKSWKDNYTVKPTGGSAAPQEYFETFTVLGWEDIVIQAGKFRAVKLEYKQARGEERARQTAKEGKAWYWYSPDVKYMVKCQYERTSYWGAFYDWELASFELKK